jgi:hypothetical protein
MSRSTVNKMRRTFQHLSISAQRTVRYVAKGAFRIFSPTEDDYPRTGVQPFHGDRTKD